MTSAENRKLRGKTILIVILIAILTSVVVTLIQVFVLGKANVAITGGLVGALMAFLALNAIKKREDGR